LSLLLLPEERSALSRQQIVAIAPKREVLSSWHGGEPTTLGLDYFRRILDLAAQDGWKKVFALYERHLWKNAQG
jgi:sulfatase maturation enzyme AslB (radical SAM superfamily)